MYYTMTFQMSYHVLASKSTLFHCSVQRAKSPPSIFNDWIAEQGKVHLITQCLRDTNMSRDAQNVLRV